jgi:NAD(P)-dependent dehydrogenase (short-subunit alcohol dehydrogenase family)
MDRVMSEHAGKVAVVTGGNSGIGKAIAQRLQREQSRVHVFDLTPESTQASKVEPPIAFHNVDVSEERSVDEAFAAVQEQDGPIDYLICCAAVFPSRPFLEIPFDEWQRTLSVNLTGSFLCSRAALRSMRPRRFGRIILFSSMVARTGGRRAAAYAASKGGVLGLARALALEVALENIRVNTISPGITDTPQPRGHLTEEELFGRAAEIPLGRIGSTDDMTEACLFLLSADSDFLTGQDLRVNGGASLW